MFLQSLQALTVLRPSLILRTLHIQCQPPKKTPPSRPIIAGRSISHATSLVPLAKRDRLISIPDSTSKPGAVKGTLSLPASEDT